MSTTNVAEDIELLRERGYRINYPHEKLGEGMFGDVYKGVYKETLHVAIKVIDLKSGAQSVADREYVENEKYILTEISHRNVVKIHEIIDMGESNPVQYMNQPGTYQSADRTYIVMEYADQGSLVKWMRDNYNNPWNPSGSIKIIKDMISGMRHLHHRRIYHGDVHPGNLLIFKEGTQLVAKWTDFGLSKIAGLEPTKHTKVLRNISDQQFVEFCRQDVWNMFKCVLPILQEREEDEETQQQRLQINTIKKMINAWDQSGTIDQLYEPYRHILNIEEDPPQALHPPQPQRNQFEGMPGPSTSSTGLRSIEALQSQMRQLEIVPQPQPTRTVPKVPAIGTIPKVPTSRIVPKVPATGTVPKIPTSRIVPKVSATGTIPKVPTTRTVPKVPATGTVPKVPATRIVPKVPATSAVRQTEANFETQGLAVRQQVVPQFVPEPTISVAEDMGILLSLGYWIDYRTVAKLGEGEFGEVYKGIYTKFDPISNIEYKTDVAVKVIDLKYAGKFVENREYLQIEKYVLTEINHKNVVKVHEIIDTGNSKPMQYRGWPGVEYQSMDRTYIIMDYADLGTLRNWIIRNYQSNTLNPSGGIKIMKDMICGLRYLHHRRIHHGDIKIDNLLIFSEVNQGVVAKWSDFGMSKIAGLEPSKPSRHSSVRRNVTDQQFVEDCRLDVWNMLKCVVPILQERKEDKETPEERRQMNAFQKMINTWTKNSGTIDQLYQPYHHILNIEE